MLDLNKQLPQITTPAEKTRLERQLASTDAEIDRLVYELYGLTEDEIRVIEGNELSGIKNVLYYMITSNQAIEKAFNYFSAIKPEYLGAKPENIRLETIQLFDTEWVVVLSYLASIQDKGDSPLSSFLQALSYQRYYKEFELRSDDGEIIAMRNPEAPVTIEHATLRHAS